MKKTIFYLLLALLCTGTPNYAYNNANNNHEESEQQKVVFLTGAIGFIGSNFLKYMFEKYPHYYFIVLDALTYAANPENLTPEIKNSSRFEFIHGSVTNYGLVSDIMRRAHLVVHFAAESHVARSIWDDSVFFDTDVLGTRVMMATLVKSPNVERFIHISTSEVYGTAESEPMTEDHLLQPRSPYAAAKAGADRLVYSYFCTYNVPALIIRPFNQYGPNQHPEKLIPRMITSALNGEQLTVHGDGSSERDWLYVADTCQALDLALHTPDFNKIKQQVINLGSGRSISVLDIAKKILEYFNLPEDRISFIGDRPGQVARHISSTDKAADLLGWRNSISFEDGLQKTIEWYLGNKAWWKRIDWMKHVTISTSNNTLEKH